MGMQTRNDQTGTIVEDAPAMAKRFPVRGNFTASRIQATGERPGEGHPGQHDTGPRDGGALAR